MMEDTNSTDWQAFIKTQVEKWRENPTAIHFGAMLGCYSWLVEDATASEPNNNARLAALDYFATVMTAFASSRDNQYSNMFNNLLAFIPEKQCIEHILRSPEGEDALAWFCCTVASRNVFDMFATNPDEAKRERDLATLLVNWTGKPFQKKTPPQLEQVVSHLYGQTCWDMLGVDIKWPANYEGLASTVFDITMSKLPFVFKNSAEETNYSPNQPPSDMVL